jgi:large subunit ribosomal protein L55
VYKVRLQKPDGSSYIIRYHEPRELVRLPVDPNSLTEEEKQARLNRLKPEKEIEVHEFDDEETEIIQRSWKDFVASR